MHRSYRYRCRHCISRIRSRHHFKQNAHVRNRSRHRPNHANPGKRADACGKVAGGWNSSRRRLQTAYAAEVRRHANRAAAIAAHSACRASRRNGCRFAAAGAAGAARQIPGIACLSANEVIRFVRHKKFRRVRVAQKNRAGCLQSCGQRGVRFRKIIPAQQRARRTRPTRHIDAAL